MENIEKLQPRAFTKFCVSIGMVPSSYTTGLTYEEQLLWLCSYLENEVIPAVNNNAEAVTELQGLYIQLKDYVDHYFDNLDVQQEINNKLDDMAESGELADIIAQYIQLQGILAYNSVADMKAAENLVDGSFAETYGYYSYGDGGNAKYKIRQVQNTDVEDDMFIIALHDTNLVAELIIEDKILNVLKVGVKNDNSVDISTKINTLTENYSLFLPAGEYKVDNTINLVYSLYGEGYRKTETNNDKCTQLLTNVATTIVLKGNTTGTQEYNNISIKINEDVADTNVITYDPTTYCRAYLKEISVFNFSGTAINLDANSYGSFISQGVEINNATLYAKPYQNSIGIKNSSNNGDNRFINVSTLFTKMGIQNFSTIILDNLHIWCGGTGEDSNDWWYGTRGIFNIGNITGNNIYLDTTYIAIINDNGKITLNNMYYYEDDSISGSSHYDGSIVYGTDDKDRLNVNINNGQIFIGERIKYINGKISNLKLIYNSLGNLNMASLRDVNVVSYELIYRQSTSTNRYLPVAIIPIAGNGYCEINITGDGGQNGLIKVSKDWQGNTIIKGSYFNINNNYYYKIDNNIIYIYMESNLQDMFIRANVNGLSYGLFPLDMNGMINNSTGKFIGEDYILTDSTGLTSIVQTQVNT